MIEIRNLSKQYKSHPALTGLNLEIGQEMFGLLGPNGAGKTTLMRILSTLLEPTEGTVRVGGLNLLSDAEHIRKITGYLPQYFHLYPQLTAYEFLDYVAVMKGIKSARERKSQIGEILHQVNLTDKARAKIKTFSGGMKQRLGIAQALLGDPRVLIVDEPTAGLDPEERVRFRNLLNRSSLSRTVLLSTHIVADIESSCSRLAVLHRGRVAFAGSLAGLQECAEGLVWEAELSEREFAAYEPHEVVTARRTDHGMLCRIVSATPPAGNAAAVKPTLEDGYLALIGGDRRA
ncbi:ABC transporter ATP-binding protein [Paenibacillus chitinolyticus]|uniref:ABC transporter ATP-binding protein n=1 Tax=Paenibacillus chitinolyticus TaxID=79263 RepID=UPI002DB7C6B0|nr:ABC transporter ATP-binding protein [Paenibacillus chitinolyticus]MEC0244733.1 ABC transporter ATP-binding protein [Paenibacillus chitinolyticus]